jgi:hypothetical protein
VTLAVPHVGSEIGHVALAVRSLDLSARSNDGVGHRIDDLDFIWTTALARTKSCELRIVRGREVVNVFAQGSTRTAPRSTVDSGRRHGVNETAHHCVVARRDRRPSNIVEIIHASHLRDEGWSRAF